MSAFRNLAGVPLSYRGWLWSKILDTLAGSAAANGDILYRTGGLWSRLPIGTNGKLLKTVGGLPAWGAIGAGGGVGLSATIYQTSDLVIDNTTTGSTFVDTQLIIGLDTGTYFFEFQNFLIAHATPDVKHRLHFTGTADFTRYLHTAIIESNASYFNSQVTAFDTTNLFTNTANCLACYYGTVEVSSAGDLSYQTAQNSASATQITGSLTGSSLMLWKIA